MLSNFHSFRPRGRNYSLPIGALVFALIAVMLLLFPLKASLAGETSAPRYRLHVRPSICVSYDSAEPCTMAMEVSWEGEGMTNVCLRDEMLTPVLYCWKNASAGTIAVDYANTTDVMYQLIEETTLGVLAEAEVKVINRDLRSSRKRRRHVWSIL
jgi:hypothetical protein